MSRFLPSTYNDWALVSLSPFPLAVKLGVVVLVVVTVGLVLWSYVHARRRILLGVMRVAAAALVIAFVLEPALQLRAVRRVRNRLALVVDRSLSMSLPDKDGGSRYDHVLATLKAAEQSLTKLAEEHVVEWFDLDGPSSAATLESAPQGTRTDLLTALERARTAQAGRPLAAIVLISDGADNVDLQASDRQGLAKEGLERLGRLEVPVNTVMAGGGRSFKDLAVAEVLADEFAFVHNTLEISVRLESVGLGALSVPVTLRREGQVISTLTAAVPEGGGAEVVFATKPDQIGEFVYSVDVPQVAGDAVLANNRRTFVLRVIRDKVRVLQVAGRPSWDERFLRQHLKENPNVDLVSFFILRTQADTPGAPDEELSLIPFPVDKLFTTELKSFDVIIFQNFDYRPYQMSQYLPNIRDAVKGGLGFVMIGGDQSFGAGGYGTTPIAEIVPLNLDSADVSWQHAVPEITPAGRGHPVTDLTRGNGSNERLWKALPAWRSINISSGLRPEASALVVDTAVRDLTGNPAPLVAAMDVGQGRSLAIASDSMWRWRFASHRDGGSAERAYHRFWSNALHWLVRDPEHSRIRVLPDKRRFDIEEPVDLTVTVKGRDYQTVAQANVRLQLELAEKGVNRDDTLTTGEAGSLRQRYLDLAPGAYRVRASATAGGEDLGHGSGVFVIESRQPELVRGAPRPDLLEAIADATHGNALELTPDAFAKIRVIDPEVVEVDRRRNIELWDTTAALVLATLLLASEWALRRNNGYL
ncbi:MAG: hypothetical protein HY903_22505 [Deltaproteobacteria bacterium]|nr:hypothetical protein [Deltaproteobacteria bacterium]